MTTHFCTTTILDRHNGKVLFSAQGGDGNLLHRELLGLALLQAAAMGIPLDNADLTGAILPGGFLPNVSLRGADLSYCNLSNANLEGADLLQADLSNAYLGEAILRGAHLRGARLLWANLRGANLAGAHLQSASLYSASLAGADLTKANFTDADLTDADLTLTTLLNANLVGANLSGVTVKTSSLAQASLNPIKKDLYKVLAGAVAEAPAFLLALQEGRVDGSSYSGACACLVGTIANVRGVKYERVDFNPNRPIERFILGIKPGDIPGRHPIATLVAEWTGAFIEGVTMI